MAARMNQRKKEEPQFVRTIAELCLLFGLAILSLSQFVTIFDWSIYVAASGGIIFGFGYVLIKLIAEKGRPWTGFDLLLIVGIVLASAGVFLNLALFLWGGLALLATPTIPHILHFVQTIGSYFVKSYREISENN
jgi:hypothetical protein